VHSILQRFTSFCIVSYCKVLYCTVYYVLFVRRIQWRYCRASAMSWSIQWPSLRLPAVLQHSSAALVRLLSARRQFALRPRYCKRLCPELSVLRCRISCFTVFMRF